MIFLWLAVAAFQQSPMVEVTRERIELTPDQQRAFAAVSRFGVQLGRCRRYMPADQIASFEASALSGFPVDQPGGEGILDQIFYMSYQQGAESADADDLRKDHCAARMDDAAAMLVDAEPLIPAVEADMPPVSARVWARFVPESARAPGRTPRTLEPLREPSGLEQPIRPNAVSTAPTWAETPRLAMPAAALNLSEGAAHIECIVTVEGRARACQLLRESVAGMGLGEAALAAEGTYRFHPRTVDGQAVEARAAFTIRFRNKDRIIEVQ